ncbi:hypothetical protein WJ47_21690 [Burkholderia ubonensis]|uniref:DUF1839 family protein n=1 Tax=Burkholderia ubonensis TaxID=101571 RepID=A0AB73FU90_9BURK|nr:DUF1839 family protein [Burkholderia ubonensis]KVK83885.1 hypothetical protein WJ44_06490 [Burkholderia ubonensis]KVL82924.1 hypothetical protein WJ47_21690 [Burkholderia ubonensis]KVM23921.1 hypothetical protein WJ53_17530 [Burkholderia ubonensis]KVM35424.1 hypothetical protein WJ54_35900 [Burkholderia ubonensis]
MTFVSHDDEDASFDSVIHRARHYRPHQLHSPDMIWKQTNCYVDLWLEVLRWWGFNPYAALPFTIALDFEGDQFTFFKFPHGELEQLYGIVVQEHSIYKPLDVHIETQVARAHLMIVEVDAWFLPDTLNGSYRTDHAKTTIGIDAIDRTHRKLGYFHNRGYYVAEGFDYDGLVGGSSPIALPPYVECAKRRFTPLEERALCDASLAALSRHLRRIPPVNPVSAFRRQFRIDARQLARAPLECFHAYSFNSVRQLGANFELFGHYARWLQASGCAGPFAEIRAACDRIASGAMVLELRLARACARGKVEHGDGALDAIEAAYADLVDCARRIAPPPRNAPPAPEPVARVR